MIIISGLGLSTHSFAQPGSTTRSVEMRPGTTAPDLPTHNKIADRLPDPLEKDRAAIKLNASEVQLKRSRWAKPKVKTPKKTNETPNRQR